MATKSQIERLLGKAILDEQFRKLLTDDPYAAAASVNVTLTAAQAASIKNLNPELLDWWAKGFLEIKDSQGNFLW